MLFWSFLIVNFIIQSKSQGAEFIIINGFGFTMIPLSLLAYASLAFTNDAYPKKFLFLVPFAVILTNILLPLEISFTTKAMPYAFVGALPLFYVSYCYLVKRAQITGLMAFHAVVLILLAIHSFNFAFFRMEPEAQLWGWPVAYAIYQLLAGLLPALTIDFYHREDELRLTKIIEAKTSHLESANAQLAKAVEQKNYLFRTLTHDISTPLSIARMKIDLFARQPKNPEKFCDDISDVTKRMEELVNQVQLFASFKAEKMNLITEEVDLVSCIRSVEALFEERLKLKDLSLVYSVDELERVKIIVDKQSFINSVMTNIISNAIKFSDPGGGIKIETSSHDNGFISLKITDNGIGMPESLRQKIFDFNAQTTRPGTQNEKGTGFGLPIIAKIVESYGGNIQVYSKERSTDEPESYTQIEL
ncbi:MAG: HAMP domain-containing sensor histidine kinase, partial [Pseudomonadota bacterium]